MLRCSLLVLIFAAVLLGCSKVEGSKVADKAITEEHSLPQEKGQSTTKEQDSKIINWDVPPMPEGAEGTFVVAADVAFVRNDPKKVFPHESMTFDQLDHEYHHSYERPFPQHFFYGENIVGRREKDNADVVTVKVKQYEWESGKRTEKGERLGYVDIKKLWYEPLLKKVPTGRWQTIRDSEVYLASDRKSPRLISLVQGEVVEALGQLEYENDLWIKARFCDKFEYDEYVEIKYEPREYQPCSRYGYIEAKNLEPLYLDKIDPSHLTSSEIPGKMRYSDLSFSDKERDSLASNGFYIETLPSSSVIYVDDMADQYKTRAAVFLTSDFFLHTFHLIFDRMLQDIEEKKLFPAIHSLTLKLVEETKKDIRSSKIQDANIQNALLHNLFFFSVAAKLFDPGFSVPKDVRSDVEAIVDRIVKAEGSLPSLENRIGLGNEDFTQYRVRGHYEKKEIHERGNSEDVVTIDDTLERYFRGMMWYGRHAFLISNDSKTLSAILMVRALQNSGSLREWEKIDNVLTRLIGKTDDWTAKDYLNLNTAIFGKKAPSIDDIAKGGDKAIKDFKEKAVNILPKQKIVSTQTGTGRSQAERIEITSGFKFLGQRFTWDSYIFNQLTSPSVGSDGNPRNLPTSLDVMSVLGSKAAEEVMAEINAKEKWDNYDSQAKNIKKEIDGEIEKKETFYNSWVSTFKALFTPIQSKQLFAINAPWQFKALNTALGSWTELKHDTILYAEHSYAESGSGDSFQIPGYEPPYVKGYVEPNPLFFNRLLDAVSNLRSELKNGFLTDEYADKLQTFESLVRRAYKIAEKEVEGGVITRDDYAWIDAMSMSFDRSLLLPREIGDIIQPEYLQMALIADVATDAVSGQTLEVAVGAPQRIIVAVKDFYGGTRLTVGYVYSWYEFADEKRWTDTEWKKMVYSSDSKLNKLKPLWYSRFQK